MLQIFNKNKIVKHFISERILDIDTIVAKNLICVNIILVILVVLIIHATVCVCNFDFIDGHL